MIDNESAKLDANEAVEDWPMELKQKAFGEMAKWKFNHYPTEQQEQVGKMVATFAKVDQDKVTLLGQGSDEGLFWLGVHYALTKQTIICPPTFGVYEVAAKKVNGKILKIPLDEPDFILPTDDIIAACQACPSYVIITNPNNPTGNSFPKDDVVRIITETDAVVVLDEAYCEYSDKSLFDLVNLREGVICLRTFSKAFGLAGIRMGYAVAGTKTTQLIGKLLPEYNCNCLSLAVVKVALENLDTYYAKIEQLKINRGALYSALCTLPNITVYPSVSGYVFTKWPKGKGQVAFKKAREAGILVRSYGDNKPDYLRISVGTPESHTVLVNAWQKLWEEEATL